MVKKIAKKSKSVKKATVHVGMQRMDKIVKAAHKAGVGKDFKKMLGKNKKAVFLQMDRKKFDKLKKFVKFEPKLATHPAVKPLSDCDCDPQDPFCICV